MKPQPGRRVIGKGSRPHVLIFAPHTRVAVGRSGIHRVTMRLIEHLPRLARVDLVKWDDIEGQLRYCDRADMKRYFGRTPLPDGLAVHAMAHRVEHCFADTLDPDERVIVLMPEVFHLGESGNEIHSRVIAQSIVSGWTTAAVFYDLIPLKSDGYAERSAHARCVAELARVDVVLPISHYVADDLDRYRRDTMGGFDAPRLGRQMVTPVPLPDRDRIAELAAATSEPRRTILLLGTIEPRKQQLRVIRAFERLRLAERAGLRLVLVGGLNPLCEAAFKSLTAANPDVTWLGRAADDEVDAAFSAARFSVFASNEEGFGLPIVESLSRGVPCLTAGHGAMREAAEGGGCLLIDVDDDDSIEAGLERLAFDDGAIATLRAEIDGRPWRSWADYAREVLAALETYTSPRDLATKTAAAIGAALASRLGRQADGRVLDAEDTHGVVVDIVDAHTSTVSHLGADITYVVVITAESDPLHLPQAAFDAITAADAWFCHNRSAYDAVIARAAASGTDGLLSGCCGWSGEPGALAALIAERLAARLERRIRNRTAAARDAAYRQAMRVQAVPAADAVLAIVISTYNGAAFIERNIAHTLDLIKPLGGRVRLVVADNASTDDTPRRVAPFVASGAIEYLRLACNTGLLGNLHFVSSLIRAQHVWAIGVDDVIVPGALERILAVLAADPACPFVLPNFSVYHRESFAAQETCANLIADSRTVGVGCRADGATDVREAASQHDNLLTAFYIIIFRSDLMSAVFNGPFTAPFFGSLVDTIPSTKVILEAFPDYAATWLEMPVITGNAHNTWRHHRVAWHGILMPQAFELAREAGLDRCLLRRWARQHVALFAEAEQLYPNPGVADTFRREDLEPSFRVFGTRLLTQAVAA